MSAADAVPVAIGLAGGVAMGCWSLADRLRAIAHDKAQQRLESEETDHDRTRAALAEAKRRIIDLESQLAARPGGK